MSDNPHRDQDRYPATHHDEVESKLSEIQGEIDRLQRQQEAIEKLATQVTKIDCDIGSGTITFDGDTIKVNLSDPNFSDDVKFLVNEYNWPRQMDNGYETRSQVLTWTLWTDLETLVKDHQRLMD